jgi:hypothetical protein
MHLAPDAGLVVAIDPEDPIVAMGQVASNPP